MALRRKLIWYERVLAVSLGGLRLYYPNACLGSVGVHLLAPVWNWLESLPGFIG